MPSYEAVFILKKLARPETAQVLKRTASHIFNQRGVLFAIENLGTRNLPYKISMQGKPYREGSYFLMRFDAPPTALDILEDEYHRDVDIIRSGFVKIKAATKYDCTLEDELQPPAYRDDVQQMIDNTRKVDKYKFKSKTGLKYNPFRT